MNRIRLLSNAIAWATLLAVSPAFAADNMPSDKELKAQCRQYAAEDGVTPDSQEEYILQCVSDLRESHLPVEGEEFNQNLDGEFDPNLPSEN